MLGAGTLTDAAAADLNGDGVVDVFDLALVKRAVLNTAPDAEVPVQPTDPVAAE